MGLKWLDLIFLEYFFKCFFIIDFGSFLKIFLIIKFGPTLHIFLLFEEV